MDLEVNVVGKTIPLVGNNIETMSDFIVYMAKVSNPDNQFNTKTNLIEYLKKNNHWSPFEMGSYQIEIKAPRDISRQILRHASARFQEFSQRYAEVTKFTIRELRASDPKNRQSSLDIFSEEDKEEFTNDCEWLIEKVQELYSKWLSRGAAKECARVFLPEGLTMSTLYMSAPVRTWIHYLDLREGNGTQLEHQRVANEIRKKLSEHDPDIFGEKNDT